MVNVFTSPNGKDLKSVGVMTLEDNQLIEIEVFANPKGAPDSGKIVITQKACPVRKGYHLNLNIHIMLITICLQVNLGVIELNHNQSNVRLKGDINFESEPGVGENIPRK